MNVFNIPLPKPENPEYIFELAKRLSIGQGVFDRIQIYKEKLEAEASSFDNNDQSAAYAYDQGFKDGLEKVVSELINEFPEIFN